MLVKNSKLIPQILIDLASYYKVKELRVYYKRPKWAKTKDYSWIRGEANTGRKSVCLFLRGITWEAQTVHYEYWFELLKVFLHEIGHIRNPQPTISDQRYKKDERIHENIEQKANNWRNKEITRLLSLSDTLFEPNYLGIFDIITNWHFKDKDHRYRYMNEIRSRKIGSQYPLSEVIWRLFSLCGYNKSSYNIGPERLKKLNKEQKKVWREKKERFQKANRQYERIKRLIKRIAVERKMGKVCVDGAGRRYLFFSYGELEELKETRIVRKIVRCSEELEKDQRRLSRLRSKLKDWKDRHFRLPPENIALLAGEKRADFEDPRQLKLF